MKERIEQLLAAMKSALINCKKNPTTENVYQLAVVLGRYLGYVETYRRNCTVGISHTIRGEDAVCAYIGLNNGGPISTIAFATTNDVYAMTSACQLNYAGTTYSDEYKIKRLQSFAVQALSQNPYEKLIESLQSSRKQGLIDHVRLEDEVAVLKREALQFTPIEFDVKESENNAGGCRIQ